MKRRLGISATAATLAFACVGDDTGTRSDITDPSPEGIIPLADLTSTYGREVISDIQVVDLGTLPGGVSSGAADINGAATSWVRARRCPARNTPSS